jgi:hypothetical protein
MIGAEVPGGEDLRMLMNTCGLDLTRKGEDAAERGDSSTFQTPVRQLDRWLFPGEPAVAIEG